MQLTVWKCPHSLEAPPALIDRDVLHLKDRVDQERGRLPGGETREIGGSGEERGASGFAEPSLSAEGLAGPSPSFLSIHDNPTPSFSPLLPLLPINPSLTSSFSPSPSIFIPSLLPWVAE